jgi:hypothetical protein
MTIMMAMLENKKPSEPLVCKHQLLLLLKYSSYLSSFDNDLFYLSRY